MWRKMIMTGNRLFWIFITIGWMTMLTGLTSSCVPKDPVVFRTVRNIVVDMDNKGKPLLRGDVVFFNPNNVRMKLKEMRLEVFVDGKKSADVDQKPDLLVPAAGEFTVPVEVHMSVFDAGLMDTVVGLFGGKSYKVEYVGYIRVRVHGVTVRVPVKFNDQFKLKM